MIGSYTSGDSSASFGRATLPSRLRPPLELCEETRPCEVIEPPKEPLTSTENVKPGEILLVALLMWYTVYRILSS